MTSIAELFVNLGIKGEDKTVGALKEVHGGLKNTASMGLEAKAAIVGAMYALEQLFARSNKAGTDLTNFNSVVGVSTTALQQYQYAARQVGVSNEEVSGTFKALQSDMANILLGKGPPAGMRQFSNTVGGISAQDIQKFAQNPVLLLQKLQEYAAKEKNQWLKNDVLKSFGVSDTMIAALNRQAFKPEVLARAPTYGEGEVKTLDKNRAALDNLENKIEMGIGHFNARHGAELIKGLDMISTKVLKLAESFEKLAEKAELFKKLGMVFEGWKSIFDGITKAIDFINGTKAEDLPSLPGEEPKKKLLPGEHGYDAQKSLDPANGKKLRGMMLDSIFDFYERTIGGGIAEAPTVTKPGENKFQPGKVAGATMVEPPSQTKKTPAGAPGAPNLALVPSWAPPPGPSPTAVAAPNPPPGVTNNTNTQNVNVNQTLSFNGDGTDTKQAADAHKKAAQTVFRQLPSQAQGN